MCVCMQERENVCMGARERVCIGVSACACWHERERHCHCFIKAIALFNGGRYMFIAFISDISKKQICFSLSYTHILSLKAFLSCTCVCVRQTDRQRERECVCERECVYDYETDTHGESTGFRNI